MAVQNHLRKVGGLRKDLSASEDMRDIQDYIIGSQQRRKSGRQADLLSGTKTEGRVTNRN